MPLRHSQASVPPPSSVQKKKKEKYAIFRMQFALMNSLNSVDVNAHRKDDAKQTEIKKKREKEKETEREKKKATGAIKVR